MEVSQCLIQITQIALTQICRPYATPEYDHQQAAGNNVECSSRIAKLKQELSKLDEYELELDLHKLWVEQSIRNTTEDLQTKKYLYVTSEDFANCYNIEKTVFVFNIPVDKTDIKISVSITYLKGIKFSKCFALVFSTKN